MSRIGTALGIALNGLEGTVVEIEVDIAPGLPNLTIVGLADTAIEQSKHRVRAALQNSGLQFPDSRVLVNLSPAAVPKHGSGFDLPIAVAILAAQGVVDPRRCERLLLCGELSLDGRLRPVRGVLAGLLSAVHRGVDAALVPEGNLPEAQMVPALDVRGAVDLIGCAVALGADLELQERPALPVGPAASGPVAATGDLGEVLGQRDAVEAIIVGAAGGHHCLLIGEPGAGKTMLAERLAGILPDLDAEAAVAVTAVHSLVGGVDQLIRRPPWQAPHHTATAPALVGGGSGVLQPGAMSLATEGVLFLDEAPEFSPRVLDALRQALEAGTIEIHRSRAVCRFPARFQLVMAANPCPCGRALDPAGVCTCSPAMRRRYLRRLSGPLLDRMDLRVVVPRADAMAMRAGERTSTTAAARRRVVGARGRMRRRLQHTPWTLNARVPGAYLRRELELPRAETRLLDAALDRGTISLRGYDRVLRTAWTIADLAERDRPGRAEIARALSWREALS